ncbi:MAG: hypothetical protein RI967_475 [Planctomycetota bacterium]
MDDSMDGSMEVGSNAAPPADLLRGPAVTEDLRPSLVASDMEGRFRRIEGRPEEAALAMLVLDPAVREAAKAVLDARLEAVRAHLLAEIDLLRDASDATRAGERKRAEEIQAELARRFRYLGKGSEERAPLLAPLAEVLPPEAHAELRRMVDEYWTAWIASETRGDRRRKPEAVEARLVLQLLQGELTGAYNAVLRPLQQKIDRIHDIAKSTDAQRAAIRMALIAHAKATGLRPNEEERAAFARAILAELDEEQRARILAAALAAL